MKSLEKFAVLFLSVLFASPFFFTGCGKKDEKPPMAIITVLDSFTSLPVVNAKVRLHLDKQSSTTTGNPAIPPDPDTKYTDVYGQVTWTLKYPSSFFAEVTMDSMPDIATKLVTFKKDKLTEVTILF